MKSFFGELLLDLAHAISSAMFSLVMFTTNRSVLFSLVWSMVILQSVVQWYVLFGRTIDHPHESNFFLSKNKSLYNESSVVKVYIYIPRWISIFNWSSCQIPSSTLIYSTRYPPHQRIESMKPLLPSGNLLSITLTTCMVRWDGSVARFLF